MEQQIQIVVRNISNSIVVSSRIFTITNCVLFFHEQIKTRVREILLALFGREPHSAEERVQKNRDKQNIFGVQIEIKRKVRVSAGCNRKHSINNNNNNNNNEFETKMFVISTIYFISSNCNNFLKFFYEKQLQLI